MTEKKAYTYQEAGDDNALRGKKVSAGKKTSAREAVEHFSSFFVFSGPFVALSQPSREREVTLISALLGRD